MSGPIILRLAFAGNRADRVRATVTAIGSALAVLILLSAATVMAISGETDRYRSRMFETDILRSNVVMAMLLFAIPILFFVAQCARLGAPSRDRRLAAFRLAGASPTQVRWIAGVETGVAAALGVAVGALVFFVGRVLLDSPGRDGTRALPTDVPPEAPVTVAVLVGVPLLSTLTTVLLLRRVAITPFGVLRRTVRHRVRAWPGLLGVVGLVGLTSIEAVSRSELVGSGRLGATPSTLLTAWVLASTIFLILGLMFGAAWVGHVGARLLLRLTRRPSALIAARQTLADPHYGSRTYTVILATIAFAAANLMLQAWLRTNVDARTAASQEKIRRTGGTALDLTETASFRSDVADLISVAFLVVLAIGALALLVALVESAVARRRTLAALVAAGTPRGVLARASCWRVLIPAIPGIAAASLAGMFAMRPVTRTATGRNFITVCDGTAQQCADPDFAFAHSHDVPINVTLPVPLPWGDVAATGLAALLCILAAIAASTLLQRSSVNTAELRAD